MRHFDLVDIEFDGIDHSDAHDFCDAFIRCAAYADTLEPLSDTELDKLNDNHSDVVYEYLMEYLY